MGERGGSTHVPRSLCAERVYVRLRQTCGRTLYSPRGWDPARVYRSCTRTCARALSHAFVLWLLDMEEALLCAPPAFLSSVACLNEWAARAPAPAQRLILALCTGSASVSPPQLPPGTDAALVATVDKCTQCLLFVRRAVLTAAAAGGLTPEAVKAALDAHTDLLPDINSLIAQAMASALVRGTHACLCAHGL